MALEDVEEVGAGPPGSEAYERANAEMQKKLEDAFSGMDSAEMHRRGRISRDLSDETAVDPSLVEVSISFERIAGSSINSF